MLDLTDHEILSHEEILELFRQYKEENNLDAKCKIIISNCKFVSYIAKKYVRDWAPYDDLFQEGMIGLISSIDLYNPEMNATFPGYAEHRIKARILHYVKVNSKIFNICTTKARSKLFFNIKKYKRNEHSFSEEQLDTISKDLNVPIKDIKQIEQALFVHDLNLDERLDADDHDYAVDIPADPMYDPLIKMEIEEQQVDIPEILKTLAEREQRIITERWLIDDPKTLAELGKVDGCSAQRIQQIEKVAISKIRNHWRNKHECNH